MIKFTARSKTIMFEINRFSINQNKKNTCIATKDGEQNNSNTVMMHVRNDYFKNFCPLFI